jgi:hypothetical protein
MVKIPSPVPEKGVLPVCRTLMVGTPSQMQAHRRTGRFRGQLLRGDIRAHYGPVANRFMENLI